MKISSRLGSELLKLSGIEFEVIDIANGVCHKSTGVRQGEDDEV